MPVEGSELSPRARRGRKAIEVFRDHAVEQLLSLFKDLDARSNKVAKEEFERLGAQPVGEYGDVDMADLAEEAHDAGLAFYETMSGLRQTTINLFAAGLFHLLEQHLADLCHDRSFTVDPPKESKLKELARWYSAHFDLDLSALASWNLVDELRLVANVVKHAEGKSAEQLRLRRADLFEHPALRALRAGGRQFFRPVRMPL